MPDPRHTLLRRLFDESIELPAAARAAFLDEQCKLDTALKRRVLAMLSAAEDPQLGSASTPSAREPAPSSRPRDVDGARTRDEVGARLRDEVGARLRDDTTAELHEGPGTRIGPYTLLQQIGEGGFGVVFMAEQSQPVSRKVALKIIKLGMDTRQVVARFEQERQALALMEHPHIARVLDAGTTVTGRPYFVMDLVKGRPIVEYCDREKLTIEARLELFAQVCGAVQHAHGKGIIHRDIKPSNILVGTRDGKPDAKVIDFGIAKATSQKLTDKTLFTEHRQVIGTLQYMSPEQAEGSLDIDTRTDVYALGILLYELLTGSTPFDQKTLHGAMFGEIQRMIREVDPPRPSTRLSESHAALADIAAQRGVEPKRLGVLLRGELDWIVMKALEKARARRYETCEALAQDVRRHLAGEVVLAAPPSAGYRVRKFVARHRGRVLAASVVVLALLVAIVGTTTGLLRALEQTERADAESTKARLAAESEATARIEAQQNELKAVAAAARAETAQLEEAKARARAEAVRDFVINALATSDAQTAGGGQDATIFAAMNDAIADLDAQRLADDPETEATLRQTIAIILRGNGRAAEAHPLAVQALALRQRVHPGDHDDVAASLNEVALALQVLGRSAEAAESMSESLAMYQRLHAGDSMSIATVSSNLATVLKTLGRPADAEPLLVDALAMYRRLSPGDDKHVAQCLTHLAGARAALGRNSEAEALYVEALAMSRRVYVDDHPALAKCLNDLGTLQATQGRADEALPLLSESLAMERRLYQGDHPELAKSIAALAFLYSNADRKSEAEALIAEALAMDQRLYPGDHPVTAHALFTLSSLRIGRPAEAEPVCEQSVDMHRRLFGDEHMGLAISLLNLARTRHALHKDTEARASFDEAIAILRRLPGGAVALCDALWRSGRARLERDDAARALPELEEAVTLAEKQLRADNPRVAQYRATLGQCKTALAGGSGK